MSGRRRVLIALLVTGAVLAIGGGAYAATSSSPVDSNGVIHSCYTTAAVKGSHAIVLQDTTTACPSGTTALNWNQKGATGPQGPAGPQGAQGPAGPQGPAGATNITVETNAGLGSVAVDCPTGTQVTGGGGFDNSGGSLTVDSPQTEKEGNGPLTVTGWSVQGTGSNDEMTVYVLCA